MNDLVYSPNFVWSIGRASELGSGATSTVYMGVNKRTGEPVAVKWFNPTVLCMIPYDVRMREFEVLKVLNHENIVKMIAIEKENESRKDVIVMELCLHSLQSVLSDPQNSYGLEEEEFLCVLKDLSTGMKYLRSKNISHRDLKPGNIMKCIKDDGRPVFKLTDFGMARVLHDDDEFNSFCGTEAYLFPDLYERAVLHPFSKTKRFKATVDLWSIGVTLYQMATGTLPFRPYGRNKETMHYITSKKATGVISGVQHTENGPIEWSSKLPKTCLLNKGLQEIVTILIAGLLECGEKQIWTFDQFFNYVTDIFNRKMFHIFYGVKSEEICLYMQPNQMLHDLENQICSQTSVPSANQLLLFGKSSFISQIDPVADVSNFPSTTLDQPLILVNMECANTTSSLTTIQDAVTFPDFPSSPECTVTDAKIANVCCREAHALKRLLIKLVRCHGLLLSIPTILLSVIVENVTKLSSNSGVLSIRNCHVSQRVETFKKMSTCISCLLTLQPEKVHKDLLKKLQDITSAQTMQFDKVQLKVFNCLSAICGLSEKVCVAKEFQNRLDKALSDCMKLDGCVERASTYIRKICDSWKLLWNHKYAEDVSPKQKQLYTLERVKIQGTCKKLSLLHNECSTACLFACKTLNKLHSDLQAVVTKCKWLDSYLDSCSTEVKEFNISLNKAEKEINELCEKFVLSSSSTIQVNGSDETNSQSKKHTFKNVSSYMQAWKSDQTAMKEILEKNSVMMKTLISAFQVEDENESDTGEK